MELEDLGPHEINNIKLLVIDPGECSGYAIFVGDQLARCGVFSPSKDRDGPALGMCGPQFEQVVIEKPQAYSHPGRPPIDPNDLVTLAVLVGRLAERYEANGCTVSLVLPRVWKGQLDKDTSWRRSMSKLSAEEILVVERAKLSRTQAHNMHDAIGIGLWKLGR